MNRIVRFSEAFAIGVHAMLDLATHPDRLTVRRVLADKYHVSPHHLAKVMHRLAQAGLVTSERGPGGGYRLARPPGDVSLLEVFEAVEGPISVAGCLFAHPICGGECCLFGNLLADAAARIRDYMAGTSLADAVRCVEGRNGGPDPDDYATVLQPPAPVPGTNAATVNDPDAAAQSGEMMP